MIEEPKWLSSDAVRVIQETLIARTGGTPGVLNPTLLESTVNKPKFFFQYEPESSIFKLAAAYGYGFVKNHCFCDGNKRIALATVSIFLRKNGYRLNAGEAETVTFFLGLAGALETYEEGFARLTDWIEQYAIELED
ncbi:MAG: type II toxin-antitoxin system death-on-curing family toxin [Microcystis aeruginosa W13-11]|nr:type II toxin-antitoxin system death-on-curing family toxin [Microcystis aeruginosa W13-11]